MAGCGRRERLDIREPSFNDTTGVALKRHYKAAKASKGMTIIQVMILVLIAGIVGAVVVDVVIDKRCDGGVASELCKNRRSGK